MRSSVKIITQKGDCGKSQLMTGEILSKDCLCFEAMGWCDELVSFLGIARNIVRNKIVKKALCDIQKDIFIANTEMAMTAAKAQKLSRRINATTVTEIDKKCEQLARKMTMPEKFIVPGESLSSSCLDYARAIVRRCERQVVSLSNKKHIHNKHLLIWFNRLSDYLFLLARFEEKV